MLYSNEEVETALVTQKDRRSARERRQAEGVAAVSRIARRINASLDLQETLDAIVNVVAELVPCSLAEIDLWDESQQALILQAIRSTPERSFPVGQVFPPGRGFTGWVVNNRQSLLVPDVNKCTDIRPDIQPGEYPFQSYLGIPLLQGERLIGALVLVHDQAGVYNEDDLTLLEALAGQAAFAIHNARIYAELTGHHHDLSILYSVASAINQAPDMETLMSNALDQVMQLPGVSAASIRLIETQSNTLKLVMSRGLSSEFVEAIKSIKVGTRGVGRVAETGEPILFPELLEQPASSPEFRALQIKEGIRARVEVPLRTTERIIGTLGVASRTPGVFCTDDIELLMAVGHQLGVAIENARLRQETLRVERMAAIGKAATGIAHDLRSPLGGILRSAEFLARPEITPKTRQKLSQAIVSMTRRLIHTSQGILDYVHGENVPLKRSLCQLSQFLDEVLAVMEVDLSDRGIEVIKQYHYTEPVLVDTDRLAQVVYNLVANARDAMPQGGRFTLSTQKAGEQVEIRFADTGPGVPKELSERIFEPFFSYNKSQGAGLGLAISRQIVLEHGGSIRVESRSDNPPNNPPGPGAVFVVCLPI